MKPGDRELGMVRRISRRDLLHGIGGLAAASFAPGTVLAQTGGSAPYFPPALTGLRGSHAGSFEVAHELARLVDAIHVHGLHLERQLALRGQQQGQGFQRPVEVFVGEDACERLHELGIEDELASRGAIRDEPQDAPLDTFVNWGDYSSSWFVVGAGMSTEF